MAKTNQNFSLYAGDTRDISISLDTSVPDLTGGSARWWVGKTPGASGVDVLLKKSATIIEQTLQVTVEVTDFANLPPAVYYHETEVTLSNGRSYTVATGTVTILPTMKP